MTAPHTAPHTALLSIENFQMAYPQSGTAAPNWVVDGVSWQLQPGERLGLVGESGCGKSTLGRAILQLLPPGSQTSGDITFEGQSILRMGPQQLRQFRGQAVALIFQDPMTRLNPLLTIGDHCTETLRAHRPDLSPGEIEAQCKAALAAVNIPASRWAQYPHEFSGGMRQRVAIALALVLNPKLIVADEPTTSLDVTVAAQILSELVRLCQERGMALILISHDLALVGEYCDRLAVMYEGKLVETGSTQAIFQSPQHPYTQTLIQSALYLQDKSGDQVVAEPDRWSTTVRAASPKENRRSSASPLLRVQDLKRYYDLGSNPLARLWSKTGATDRQIRAVDGISLELYPGESLGLVGESGCGKSTLSRTILQLLKPSGGLIEFEGQDLGQLGRAALQQKRRQIQMIFQDPSACLNPRMTVAQSIADPLLIHKLKTPSQAREQVELMLKTVGLDPGEFADRYPGQLSGGQQQRVAIARALITRPQLVICDEPVSMLDATVRTQVLDLMQQLKIEFSLTYLFITHDLWVARFFCDRIAVMHQGKIVEIGPAQQVFADPQHDYTKTLLAAAPMLSQTAR
jgi:peptide/nickel transport system ATP-binding protein